MRIVAIYMMQWEIVKFYGVQRLLVVKIMFQFTYLIQQY